MSRRTGAAARPATKALSGLGIVAALMLMPATAGGSTTHTAPGTQAVSVVKNVIYEHASGIDRPLDVYAPGGNGPFPALVFIHGGAYVTGDKCQLKTVAQARHLAASGFVVYSIDYRLAPEQAGIPTSLKCSDGTTTDISYLQGNPYPAGADDAAAAVGWIKDNGSRYKTDTSHISCVGSSAGGTLCYGLGARGLVDAQVGWSGPTKLDQPFALDVVANYMDCVLPTGSVERSSNLPLVIAAWVALDLLLAAGWLIGRRRTLQA